MVETMAGMTTIRNPVCSTTGLLDQVASDRRNGRLNRNVDQVCFLFGLN